MRLTTTLLFLLLTTLVRTQPVDVSAKTLKKIFTEDPSGMVFGRKGKGLPEYHPTTPYNAWLTCNVDSSYYKSDTIVLNNHRYAYFEMDCSQHLEWFLGSHHRLHYIDCFYHQEPPRGGAVNFPPYHWQVKQQQSKTIVELKMKGKTTDRFEVISLDLQLHRGTEGDPMYVLTLKRINY